MRDPSRHELVAVLWRKSRRSNNSNNCVEVSELRKLRCSKVNNSQVAAGGNGLEGVGVRDSMDPDGPALIFQVDKWTTFVAGIRAGSLDPNR